MPFVVDRPYRKLQWLVPVFALLHNLEEALTMPAYAPLMRHRLEGLAPRALLAATEDLSWFYPALVIVTVIPVLVVWVATTGKPKRSAAWAVVLVQSVFLVNVFVPHVPAALLLGGYAPGVVTALLIELPYSLYFLRRSVTEGAVSRARAVSAVLLAIPVLLIGLGTTYFIANAFMPEAVR